MFHGSIVALVTPMKEGVMPNTELDISALEQLVEFHIDNGTDAIVAVGTTGESPTVTMEENCEIIRQIVEFTKGRIPVIGGTGANSTREAIELTQCAKDSGVDACLLVTPYYNKPTQEGLYIHHKTVAEAVDIPQLLYNVPSRTACDMSPETVGRLSKVPNIIGVKEATAELDRVQQIKDLVDDEFFLLSGDDATACEFIASGGHGVISVTANVAPAAMHEICIKASAGDLIAAREINKRLENLHNKLFVEANPIPVKWAVHRLGKIKAGIRLPLTWMSEHYEHELEQAMIAAGVL